MSVMLVAAAAGSIPIFAAGRLSPQNQALRAVQEGTATCMRASASHSAAHHLQIIGNPPQPHGAFNTLTLGVRRVVGVDPHNPRPALNSV